MFSLSELLRGPYPKLSSAKIRREPQRLRMLFRQKSPIHLDGAIDWVISLTNCTDRAIAQAITRPTLSP